MKGFIISVLVVCVAARPDIGLKLRQQQQGYSYNQPPATSYGVPTGSYIPSAPANNFLAPNLNQAGVSVRGNFGGGDHGSSSSSQFNLVGSQHEQSGGFSGFNGYSGGISSGSTSSGYQTSFQGPSLSSQSGSTSSFAQGGSSEVQKHVYFYDAPEDEEAPQIRVRTQAAAAQKNYKIIFIKAPAYQAPQIQQIPAAQQQNEEKTLVYVLVKKQDEGQEIVIPTSVASKPSKPEVFFIKYKTQKDAEEQIQNIQAGSSSGVSANSVSSDSELVSTIRDSQSGSTSSQFGATSSQQFGGNSVSLTSGSVSSSVAGGYQDASHHGDQSAQTYQSAQQESSHNYGPAGASGPY